MLGLVNEEMDNASGEHQDELNAVSVKIANTNYRLEGLIRRPRDRKIDLDDLGPRSLRWDTVRRNRKLGIIKAHCGEKGLYKELY